MIIIIIIIIIISQPLWWLLLYLIFIITEASLSKGCRVTITRRLFCDIKIWCPVLFWGPCFVLCFRCFIGKFCFRFQILFYFQASRRPTSTQLLLSAWSRWDGNDQKKVIEPTWREILRFLESESVLWKTGRILTFFGAHKMIGLGRFSRKWKW